MTTVFLIKNNSLRNHGFAGRLCLAGTGCPTPPEAEKLGFKLPEKFELSEKEMFAAHRGVVKTLAMRLPDGSPEIEVFLETEGKREELTPVDLESFAADYRSANGLPSPTTPREHSRECAGASAPFHPSSLSSLEAVMREEELEREKIRAEFLAGAIVRGLLAAQGGGS